MGLVPEILCAPNEKDHWHVEHDPESKLFQAARRDWAGDHGTEFGAGPDHEDHDLAHRAEQRRHELRSAN